MFSLVLILCVAFPLVLAIATWTRLKNIDTFFAALEKHLKKSNRHPWAAVVRKLAMFMTPDDEKDKQMRWIRKWKRVQEEEYSQILYQIYLLERAELLRERRNDRGFSPEEHRTVDLFNKEYSANNTRLGNLYDELVEIYKTMPAGAFTRAECAISHEQRMDRQVNKCRANGGCCSRSCQCCSRPRKGFGGQLGTVRPGLKVHCYAGCGCCIRWKGFYEPHEKERREREWRENLSYV